MKEITKYVADDGTEFEEYKDCIEYEHIIQAVNIAIKSLNPLPVNNTFDFNNGKFSIYQGPNNVDVVVTKLKHIVETYFCRNFRSIGKIDFDNKNKVAFLVETYCPAILKNAWNRIMCIDKNGREWGQQYYANLPINNVML